MHDFRQSLINSTLNKVLKRLHYPLERALVSGSFQEQFQLLTSEHHIRAIAT